MFGRNLQGVIRSAAEEKGREGLLKRLWFDGLSDGVVFPLVVDCAGRGPEFLHDLDFFVHFLVTDFLGIQDSIGAGVFVANTGDEIDAQPAA